MKAETRKRGKVDGCDQVVPRACSGKDDLVAPLVQLRRAEDGEGDEAAEAVAEEHANGRGPRDTYG